MAKKNFTNLILAVAITMSMFASPVSAMIAVSGGSEAAGQTTVGDIRSFVSQVAVSDNSKVVAGVYSDNIFSAPVVQQPANNPGYVSEQAGVLTQFGMTAQYGNIALLAHNFLQGAALFDLNISSKVTVVYGDGSTQAYKVTEVLSYQALSPLSPYSDFIDLNSGNNERLSVEALFSNIYKRSDVLILQTCIEKEGNDSWGRLFVIAEPVQETMGEKLALQALENIQ